jgi:hypothetical protein
VRVSGLTLVTVSYRPDLERFAFLRRSMRRCGVELPHVVVVPTEDVSAFAGVPDAVGLTVVANRDVLRPPIERLRLVGQRARWLRAGSKLRGNPWLGGWMAQQLVKLSMGRVVDGHWACLDSDAFFLRPVAERDFRADDGRLLLVELVDFPIGPSTDRFHRDALAFLGLSSDIDTFPRPSRTYVSWPFVFHRDVVSRLHDFVEHRHGEAWELAMTRANATEYTTYGLFARHVDGAPELCPRDLRWSWVFNRSLRGRDLAADLAAAAGSSDLRFGMVDAHLDMEPGSYEEVVESWWRRV